MVEIETNIFKTIIYRELLQSGMEKIIQKENEQKTVDPS